MQTDAQISDGSVLRMDPITGRRRVISGADYARTQLTRERDNELAMQAGAPPIARGPAPSQPAPSAIKAPAPVSNVVKPVSSTPGTLAPSDPSNPNSPLVRTAPKVPPPSFAGPAAPTNPNLPASYDRPMQNVQFADGPNISTKPTGLPEGSVGYARKDGGYTVRTADGQTRDFADEAAARAAYAKPAFVVPPYRRADAAPDGASQAWAANSAGRFAYMDAARQPASKVVPLAPAYTIKGAGQRAGQAVSFLATDQTEANPLNFVDTAERYTRAGVGAAWNGSFQVPEKGWIREGVEAVQGRNPTVQNLGSALGYAQSQARQREAVAAGRIPPDFEVKAANAAARYRTGPNGAPSFSQMEAEAVPVYPVPSPVFQSVMDAATQAPRPVATPTNIPPPIFAAPLNAVGNPLDSIRMDPADSAKFEATRRDLRNGETSGMDAGAVPAARFYDDEEPSVFPILSSSVRASRPRAIFA
jgi:hypothetical protein